MMPHRSVESRWKATLLLLGTILVMIPASAPAQQATADVPPDATPEVTAVRPNQASPGEEVAVVIDGKNFSPGVYVSFSNPAVHAV